MAMGGDHTVVAFARNSRVNTVVSSDADQRKIPWQPRRFLVLLVPVGWFTGNALPQ